MIPNDGTPDLVVADQNLALRSRRWRLIYEGKRQGGDTFDHIRSQLRGYAMANRQNCFTMGARGRDCMFFFYDGNNMRNIKIRERRLPNPEVIIVPPLDDSVVTFDIESE